MQFLNKNATIVFAKLIDSLDDGYKKIKNDPFMSLTVERIGNNISTPWGTAFLISLCHYFEQNGDLMQDPEMCFFVIDERKGFASDWDKLKAAPYMFKQPGTINLLTGQDYSGFEESVRMKDSRLTVFERKMQKRHAVFANQWLSNIQQQGFLNKI